MGRAKPCQACNLNSCHLVPLLVPHTEWSEACPYQSMLIQAVLGNAEQVKSTCFCSVCNWFHPAPAQVPHGRFVCCRFVGLIWQKMWWLCCFSWHMHQQKATHPWQLGSGESSGCHWPGPPVGHSTRDCSTIPGTGAGWNVRWSTPGVPQVSLKLPGVRRRLFHAMSAGAGLPCVCQTFVKGQTNPA